MNTVKPNGVWILAEQRDGRVLRVSHELLTRARTLADTAEAELTAVLLGHGVATEDLEDLIARGADRVLYVDAAELAQFTVEPYAACMLHLIRRQHPAILLAGATSTGRTLMPYVAAKAHTGLTADCTELRIDPETGNLLQTRPAIGGNILATIVTPNHRPQMATVRPRSAPAAQPVAGRRGKIVRVCPPAELLDSRVHHRGVIHADDDLALQDAERVIAVGRGIGRAENLALIQDLAASLDAAVGASREVVDRGWLDYPHQVGLSGKTVTPKLYVGIGISGAVQHLAGMQTAENIVVINSDRDAQMFKIAELGLVGDLFEIVPVLTRKILAARSGAAHRAVEGASEP